MNNTDERDPHICIRSDLWPTMTLEELLNQQRMVIDRLSQLASIMSGAGPAVHNLYGALQVALQDLSTLLLQPTNKNGKR